MDYSPLRFSFGVPWLADIVMCVSGGCSGESKGDGSDGEATGHRRLRYEGGSKIWLDFRCT